MEWLDGAAISVGALLLFLAVKRTIQRQLKAKRTLNRMKAQWTPR